MIVITLPDKSKRNFEEPPSIYELAQDIGPGLAKATLAGIIDGVEHDACDLIEKNSEVAILTNKDKQGLDIIRHSCAHLFGHAIKQLYPDVKMVIGPVIENGFYYDILSDIPITEKDLPTIENRMRKLAKKNYTIERKVIEKDEAISIFQDRNKAFEITFLNKCDETERAIIAEYYQRCFNEDIEDSALEAVEED